MDQLQTLRKRAGFIARIQSEARHESSPREAPPVAPALVRSEVTQHPATIPMPPIWGARVIEQMPLDLVFDCLDQDELFRLSWGAKNAHGDEWQMLKAEFEARLAAMQRRALQKPWFAPRAVYGYWPANPKAMICWFMTPASVGNGKQPAGAPAL